MVDDLFEDMKDGVKLLALLEVLSGQKLVRIFPVTILSDCSLLEFGGVCSWEYKRCCGKKECFCSG